MDILILDFKGRLAHFRKFYTNSSSLSYSVPPRTTAVGMIAAILGMGRDSYYNLFSKENLHVGVRKLCETRRIIQSLNYMKATSSAELISPKEHTQIPFEVITGNKEIGYRFYISSEDKNILDELQKRAKENRPYYPPYFGAAPFNCLMEYVDRVDGKTNESEDYVNISTVINQKYIKPRGINIKGKDLFLVREKMPSDFFDERIIKECSSYLFDENGGKLEVKLNCEYVNINYNGATENILFM
jgi:CRISPR-associated protein Cas5h